jgi:capsular exopolysaccharide synthesis family protein
LTPSETAEQVWPKKGSILAGSLVVALFLGICLSLLIDYFDPRIHNWESARQILDAPVLGFIPTLPPSERLLRNTQDQKALQSVRVLRTSIQFAALQAGAKTVLFTATQPGEGKSTNAVNYATSVAMDSKTVLLIDTDLLNPNVHRNLDLERSPGLPDVLENRISLSDAIQHSNVNRLHVLAGGKAVTNGTELLNSERMRELLVQASELYDVVVLDGPAVLSGADAQIVASLTDGVVYIVQPSKVREPSLHYAVHLLHQARAHVIGVVFNAVEPKAMENDFYYGSRATPYGVFHGLPTWQSPQLPVRQAVVESEPEAVASESAGTPKGEASA